MKSIFTLLILAFAILLSSCGSADISVLKRKYNKGYYVDVNTKKATSHKTPVTTAENTDVVVPDLSPAKKQQTEVVVENDEYPVTASTETPSAIIPAKKNNPFISTVKEKSVAESDIVSADSKRSKTQEIVRKIKHKVGKALAPEMSNETIVLLILALFPILALIAIYIKDGKKITLNFWIDLLLHLLFGGITTPVLRIFVALYAVFAVLVVLDIINLA